MFSRQSKNLGVVHGRLAPCPDSPNCVSTQATAPSQFMAPLAWTGTAQEAIAVLAEIVNQMPRARVIARQDNYLHVEFATAIFRFVDDVEFLVDEGRGVVHFRSASRVGYSDLGVNRRRMERIRQEWEKRLAKS